MDTNYVALMATDLVREHGNILSLAQERVLQGERSLSRARDDLAEAQRKFEAALALQAGVRDA